MPMRVLVLGAGFGGLELATTLSEEAAGEVEVTLIDKGDAFVFGYSKLDVMFGRTTADAVRLPYSAIAKPGVRLRPGGDHRDRPGGAQRSRPTPAPTRPTCSSSRSAPTTTTRRRPGLTQDEEFYSVAGAERMTERIAALRRGPRDHRRLRRAVQVPARAERVRAAAARPPDRARPPRPLRDHVPASRSPEPVPPSPDTIAALLEAFAGARDRASSPRRASRRSRRRGRARRRHASSTTTSSSACRSTARPTSSSRAAWPRTATSRSTRRTLAHALPRRLRGRRRRDGRRAEGRRLRRGRRHESSRSRSSRRLAAAPPAGALRRARAPATSSSAPAASAASTSTSSPARSRPGRSQEPSAELVAEKEHFGSSRRARWFS